jgi:hypothetical protein
MLTLPITSTAKIQEWNTIQNTAHNNDFPQKLIHNQRNKLANAHRTQKEQPTKRLEAWFTFNFSNPIVHRVTYLFKHTNLNIKFKHTNTIRQQLQQKLDYIPNKLRGIYKLQYTSCNKANVCQSGRAITLRYKEHIGYIRNNISTSAYAQHTLNQCHHYGPADSTLQLLKPCAKGKLINWWKTFFIQKLHYQCMLINEQHPHELNTLFAVSWKS